MTTMTAPDLDLRPDSTVALRSPRGPVAMPRLGFGVFEVPDAKACEVVSEALCVGYRSIDTATIYGNEAGVGDALNRNDVPRSEIFVTTKVWNDAHGYDKVMRSYEDSLSRLRQEYVDLLLLHWPCSSKGLYVESWRALLDLARSGRVRAVGVCNFNPEHLQRLIDETGVAPSINQVELNPYLTQRRLRAFHDGHGVVTQAWGPLGHGGALLDDGTIRAIADEVGRTPAQVILRWHLQHGHVAIPKSATPSRIAQNFAVFDVELTPGQMARLDGLDRGRRTGPDPNVFGN